MTATESLPTAAPAAAAAERSTNLDVLRAFAALAVLAGHSYQLSGSIIGFNDRNPWRLAINSGGAGVWLFFALSGYLIASPFIESLVRGRDLPSIRNYGIRRITRIYPAYLIAFAVVVVFGLRVGTQVAKRQLLVHGLLLHNLVPREEQAIFFASWTLSLEILFYVFVAAAAWGIRRLRKGPVSIRSLVTGVLVMWAGSMMWTFAAASVGSPQTQLWLRVLFPSMFSMFCPGLLVAIAMAAGHVGGERPRWFRLVTEHRLPALVLAAVLAVGGAVGATATQIQLSSLSRQLFAVAFGIVIALAITRGELRGRVGRTLGWLGLISYGIYLWQGAALYVIQRHGPTTWVPMPHTGAVAYVVHLVYFLAITIPLAWLSWHLVEQPAMRAGKAWIARIQRPARVPAVAG